MIDLMQYIPLILGLRLRFKFDANESSFMATGLGQIYSRVRVISAFATNGSPDLSSRGILQEISHFFSVEY